MPDPKEYILQDRDRSRLDEIVHEMVQNNEADETIQAVVDDFKSKYGVKKKDTPVGTGTVLRSEDDSQSLSHLQKPNEPFFNDRPVETAGLERLGDVTIKGDAEAANKLVEEPETQEPSGTKWPSAPQQAVSDVTNVAPPIKDTLPHIPNTLTRLGYRATGGILPLVVVSFKRALEKPGATDPAMLGQYLKAELQNNAREQRQIKEELSNIDVPKFEKYLGESLQLFVDAPVFGGFGKVGTSIVNPLLATSKFFERNLINGGVSEITAKTIAKNSLKNYLGNVAANYAGTASALAGYSGLESLQHQLSEGTSIDDLNYGESLKAMGGSAGIAAPISLVAPSFSFMGKMVERHVDSELKKHVLGYAEKTGEIAAEAGIFAAASPDEGKTGFEKFVDNFALFGLLKAQNKLTDLGRTKENNRVEFDSDELIAVQGKAKNVFSMEDLEANPKDIESLLKDKDIPLTAKSKIAWRYANIPMDKVDFDPNSVEVEGNVLRTRNKAGDIIQIKNFDDPEIAKSASIAVGKKIEEIRLLKTAQDLNPEQQTRVDERMGGTGDVTKAAVIPDENRTEDQKKRVEELKAAVIDEKSDEIKAKEEADKENKKDIVKKEKARVRKANKGKKPEEVKEEEKDEEDLFPKVTFRFEGKDAYMGVVDVNTGKIFGAFSYEQQKDSHFVYLKDQGLSFMADQMGTRFKRFTIDSLGNVQIMEGINKRNLKELNLAKDIEDQIENLIKPKQKAEAPKPEPTKPEPPIRKPKVGEKPPVKVEPPTSTDKPFEGQQITRKGLKRSLTFTYKNGEWEYEKGRYAIGELKDELTKEAIKNLKETEPKNIGGQENATGKGIEQGSNKPEYSGANAKRKGSATGNSNRNGKGRKGKEEKGSEEQALTAAPVNVTAVEPVKVSQVEPMEMVDTTWQKTIHDFQRDTGIPIRFKVKSRRRGVLGLYNPRTAATGSVNANDLRVLTHEIGHHLSDRFGMFKDLSEEVEKELMALSPTGSKPPRNISKEAQRQYKLAEGMAEYLSSRIVNPTETRRIAPEFSKVFDAKISDQIRDALNGMSTKVRSLLTDDSITQMAANLASEEPKKERKLFGSKKDFYVSWTDVMIQQLADPIHVTSKAFDHMARRAGILRNKIIGKKDAIKQIRILSGHNKAMMVAFERGIQDANFETVRDKVTGKPMSNEWLFEELVNMSDKTEKSIIQAKKIAISVGNSQRVVDLVDRRLPEDKILTDLQKGLLPDESIYELHSPYIGNKIVGKNLQGEPITADEMVETLRNQGVEPQPEANYDFSNITVLGEHGGYSQFGTDYQKSRRVLEKFNALPDKEKNSITETLRRYRAIADANLRFMVDTGRKSEDWYNRIKEDNPYYISFARAYETAPDELYGISGITDSKGRLGTANEPVKGLKLLKKGEGSSQAQVDPFISLWTTTSQIVNECRRNQAMRAFTDMLDGTARAIGEDGWNMIADIGTRVEKEGPNTLKIYDHGHAQFYRLHKELYDQLNNLGKFDPARDLTWMKVLSAPVRIIEYMVTRYPSFFVRNKIRDIEQLFMYGKAPNILDTLHPGKEAVYMLELAGGGQFGLIMNKKGFERAQKEMIAEWSKKDKDHIFTYLNPHRAWQKYNEFLGSVENSTRASEFKSAYKKFQKEGYDHVDSTIEATASARDLLDFSVQGTAIRNMRFMIPFLNPAIQSRRKMYKEMFHNPGKFAIRFMLTQGLAELAQSAIISLSDDDTKEKYASKTDIAKALFYYIPIGNNKFLTIPKNFEIGAMGSLMGRLFDKILWNDDEKLDRNTASVMINAMNPIDPTVFVGGSGLFKDLQSEYDSFRQKFIIPVDEQKQDIALRKGTKYASELGKEIQDMSGNNIDARNADYVITKLGGGFGNLMLGISNIGAPGARQKLDITSTGFVRKNTPYTNENVQECIRLAYKYQLSYSKEYIKLKNLVYAFYGVKDDKQRDMILDSITTYSKHLREYLNNYEKTKEYASKVRKAEEKRKSSK